MKIRLFLVIALSSVVASDDSETSTKKTFPAQEVVSRLSLMMEKVFSKLDENLIGTPQENNLQLQFAGFSGVIKHRGSSPDNCEPQKEEARYLEGLGYMNRSGSYYKFYKTEADWSEANKICSKEGTHLIIIDSEAEAQVVADLLAEKNVSVIYIGLTDIEEEGVFVSVLGDRLGDKGYIQWSPTNPDNSEAISDTGEDCVTFNQEKLSDDIHCDAKYSFVCKSYPLPTC